MSNRASLLLTVLVFSCEGVVTPPPVSFSRDVLPIFQGNCMPCHWSPMVLDVSRPAAMVNVPTTWEGARHPMFIVPGKPEESFLIDKLTATDLGEKEGGSMPMAFPRVTPEELQTIRQWIAEGADAGDPNFNPGAFNAGAVMYIFGRAVNLGRTLGKCSLCHGPGTPYLPNLADPFEPDGGALTHRAANGALVIIAGDPDNSLLVKKLMDPVPAGAGRAMPLEAPPLTAQQLELVRQWIREGAKDN